MPARECPRSPARRGTARVYRGKVRRGAEAGSGRVREPLESQRRPMIGVVAVCLRNCPLTCIMSPPDEGCRARRWITVEIRCPLHKSIPMPDAWNGSHGSALYNPVRQLVASRHGSTACGKRRSIGEVLFPRAAPITSAGTGAGSCGSRPTDARIQRRCAAADRRSRLAASCCSSASALSTGCASRSCSCSRATVSARRAARTGLTG
jgi:hypothetical protein